MNLVTYYRQLYNQRALIFNKALAAVETLWSKDGITSEAY